MKSWARRGLKWAGIALLLWFVAVSAWIWVGPGEDDSASAEYAIVLGAAVDGDKPSPVFASRIDHAIDLWRSQRVRQIIFTGGTADGDAVSEAEAARDYARNMGVPAEAIILEDRSQTTRKNLGFAQPGMLGIADGSVLVVSDPLHMRRAMQMAGALGYDAQPSATPSTRYRSFWTKAPFALREVYFIHHFWLYGE